MTVKLTYAYQEVRWLKMFGLQSITVLWLVQCNGWKEAGTAEGTPEEEPPNPWASSLQQNGH